MFEAANGIVRDYPAAVTATATFLVFALNLGVTLIIRAFDRQTLRTRITKDRKYQAGLFLYQNLVIKDVETAFRKIDQLRSIFLSAFNSVAATSALGEERQKILIEHIEKLDQIDAAFRAEHLPKCRLFSEDLSELLEQMWEEYYDGVTNNISTLYALKVETGKTSRCLSSINSLKESCLAKMMTSIREHHPPVID